MMRHIHSLTSPPISSMFLISTTPTITTANALKFPKKAEFNLLRSHLKAPRCSASVAEAAPRGEIRAKPSPAEVSRTIMELCSVGTLSRVGPDGWPLGVGARFLVDERGTPVLCLDASNWTLFADTRCSLHVQLEQCGARTPQCTLQGNLNKPEDGLTLKRLHALWGKRFGEEVDGDLLYTVAVEQVFQLEDFREDGTWVKSPDYVNASPDPLRNCAASLVNEMNSKHMEDVHRFCNIYVDSVFQVMEAKMIWVDRLGFDVHLCSHTGVYEARIPFPREVTDERGAKSSFNCMSQLAWEVEKNYTVPEFEKVKYLKEIKCIRP